LLAIRTARTGIGEVQKLLALEGRERCPNRLAANLGELADFSRRTDTET
jgi:hypothetical protein